EVRRELVEERAQPRAEQRDDVDQARHRLGAVVQPPDVRDALRRLDGEPERFRHFVHPAADQGLGRPAVERVVDLDGVESPGLELQLLLRRQLLRVEVALPLVEREAAGADPRPRAHGSGLPSRNWLQVATASARSSSTCSSVRPLFLRTWNMWSACSITCSVARSPSRRTTGSSRVRAASASRVPCRNSSGTVPLAGWSARDAAGRPAGWSGKPRNAMPATPGSGWAAAARDVMRPPIDLPPAISGMPAASCRPMSTAARTVSSSSGSGSIRREPSSTYGNW